MKNISVLILMLFLPFLGHSQTTDDIKKEADGLFKKEQFVQATPLYLQLLNVEPRNHELNYKYGTCLIYSAQDKSEAIRFLNFSVKSASVDPRAHFYLGKAFHLNFQFSKAISSYQKFKSLASANDQKAYNVNAHIDACKNGKQLLANITDMIVINKTEVKEQDFYELYQLDNIGGSILVTDQFQTKIDKKLGHRPIIYFPQDAPYIFYSSYGETGETGLDIYVKQKMPNGKWSEAVKVVGDVNTDLDEDYPFLSLDGKYLYYSSKGHNSMGGYDVFRSKVIVEGSSFSKPENMDFAISSPNDDVLYIVDSLDRTAYFSSARESQDGKLYVYEVRVEKIPMQLAVLKGDFVNEIEPNNRSVEVQVTNFTTGAKVGTYNSTPGNGSLLLTIPKSGKYVFEMTVKGSAITHRAEVSIPYIKEFRPLKIDLVHQLNNGQEVIVLQTRFDDKFDDPTAIMADVYQRISKLDPNANNYNLDSLNNLRNADDIFVEAGLDKYSTREDIQLVLEKAIANQSQTKTNLEKNSFLAHNIAATKQAAAIEKMKEASKLIDNGLSETDPTSKKSVLTKAYKLTSEAQVLNKEAETLVDLGDKFEAEIKEGDKDLVAINSALLAVKAVGQNDGEALNSFVEKNTAVLSLASKSDINTTVLERIEREGNQKSQELNSVTEKLDDLKNRQKTVKSNIEKAKVKLANTKKKKEAEVIETDIQSLESELDIITKEVSKYEGKLDRFNDGELKSIALVKAVGEVKDDDNQTEENTKPVSNAEKLKIKYSVDDQVFSEDVKSAEAVFAENNINGESIDLVGLNESTVVPVEYKTISQIEDRIEKVIEALNITSDPSQKEKLQKELTSLNALKEDRIKENEQLSVNTVLVKKSDLIESFNERQTEIIGIKDVAKQKTAQAKLDAELKDAAIKRIKDINNSNELTAAETSEIEQLEDIVSEANKDLADFEEWKVAVANQDNFADFTYQDALKNANTDYEDRIQEISNSNTSSEEKAEELKVLNESTLASAKEKLQEAEAKLANNPDNELAIKEKRQYSRLVDDLETKKAIPLVDPVKSDNALTYYKDVKPDALLPNYSENLSRIENSGINDIDKEKAKLNINRELLDKVNAERIIISKNEALLKSKDGRKTMAELEKLSSEIKDEMASSEAIIDKMIADNPGQENSVESIFSNYTSQSYQINELATDAEKVAAIESLNEEAIAAIDEKIKKTKIANAANPREELQYEIEELETLKKELVTNKSKDYYGVVTLSSDEDLADIKGNANITDIEPDYYLKMETIVQDAISEKDLERKKLELNEAALAKTNRELRRVLNGINTNPSNKKQLTKRSERLKEIQTILENQIFDSKTIIGEDAVALNIVVDVEDANPNYAQRVNEIRAIGDQKEKENAVVDLNRETVDLIEQKISIIGDDIQKNGRDRKKVMLIQKYAKLIAEIEANPQLPAKGSVSGAPSLANIDSDTEDSTAFPVIYKDVEITEAIPSYKTEFDSILSSVNTLEEKEQSKIELYERSIENLKLQKKELETYSRIDSPNKKYAEEKLTNLQEIIDVLESEIEVSEEKIANLSSFKSFAGISDIMPDYETRKEKIEYENSGTIDKLQKTNELNKVLLFEIDSKIQELEKLQKEEESDTRAENIYRLNELSQAIDEEISQTNNILRESEEEVDLVAINENKFESLDPDLFEDDLEVKQLNLIKKDVRLIKTYEKTIARLERKKARLSGNDAEKVQKEIDKTAVKQSTLHNRLISDLEGVIDEKLWKELSASKENSIKIKGANMRSDEIRNAEEGILIAEAKIERAKDYRREAAEIKNQVIANNVLLKAAQLEYEAQQILELSNTTLTTAAIVSELTNSEIVVVDVNESVDDRTSSDLFKLATDIERKAFAAEDRATQLADSSLTVRKKYRNAIVLEMEQIKEEAVRLRTKADEIREKAIEVEEQEKKLLAVKPVFINKDVPKTDQLVALKSSTYSKYYEELMSANKNIDEIETLQSEIDKLKDEAAKIIREAIVIDSKSTMEDHQSNPEVIKILTQIDEYTERQKILKEEAIEQFRNAKETLENSSDSKNVKESIAIMAQRNVLPSTEIVLTQADIDNTATAAVIETPVDLAPTISNTETNDVATVNPADNGDTAEPADTVQPSDVSEPAESAVISQASTDFIPPSKLDGQLFRITNEAVYSKDNPIPVDAKQPEGLVYKVQVGAFRNPLPPQSFDKFAPISGQVLSSGVTRYMVGYFTNFSPADEAKTEIRGINGYSDAFVVAYFNGERVTISRARALENEGVIPNAITSVEPAVTPSNTSNNENTQVQVAVDNAQDNNTDDNTQTTTASQNDNGSSETANVPVQIDNSTEVVVKPVTDIDKAKTDYYTSVQNAAPASQVEIINGLFYTVQIGVYSQPVPASELFNVTPLNSQLTKSGKIRYSTGIYTEIDDATKRKTQLVEIGIVDAFVTAYFNGDRISISESKNLLAEQGLSILTNGKTISEVEGEPASRYSKENIYYRILLGRYENTVPSNVANYLFNDDNIFFETEIDVDNTIYLYTQKFSDLNEVKKRLVEINELGFENMEILAYYNILNVPFEEAQKIINNEPINDLTEFDSPKGINADNIFYEAEAIYYRVNIDTGSTQDISAIMSKLDEVDQSNFEQETTADGMLLVHSENITTFAEAENILRVVTELGLSDAKIAAFHKYVQISIEKALEIKGK